MFFQYSRISSENSFRYLPLIMTSWTVVGVGKRVWQMLQRLLICKYLEYCNIVWATGNSVMLNKLLVLQNKVLRIITNSPWNTHTPPIFSKLNILTVFGTNKLQTACFMNKVMNTILPSFFVNMFTVNSTIHNYNPSRDKSTGSSRTCT